MLSDRVRDAETRQKPEERSCSGSGKRKRNQDSRHAGSKEGKLRSRESRANPTRQGLVFLLQFPES
jgi:hypothetical protein